MARTRTQKRAAKERNLARREALLHLGGEGRVRRHFAGKARSGGQAELVLSFSGDEVIYLDPSRPTESLAERAALVSSRRSR